MRNNHWLQDIAGCTAPLAQNSPEPQRERCTAPIKGIKDGKLDNMVIDTREQKA